MEEFERIRLLIGKEKTDRLEKARVAVFGVGGVGGNCVEALVRSGIGGIDIFDDDDVSVSNINRQIIALHSTVGKAKVDVMKDRIHDINPNCSVHVYKMFFLPNNSNDIDFGQYDYVVDAIDTVSGKIEIIMKAKEAGVPVISSMGTGNKLHPEMLKIEDIYKTSVCPLARVMRHEMKKRNVESLKVLYSQEKPIEPIEVVKNADSGKIIPGSSAFVPPTAGMIIASQVIRDILNIE